MPQSVLIRPLAARWRDWLPLAVLLVALASLFALGGDRGYFYRPNSIHNQITAKNLAIAGNMSPKHGFRLAIKIWRKADGGFRYALYGRFPVGGYVLINLAASPFGSDLAAKLLAARVLMLLMFCGAAIFAYLALARITGNRWIALSAVLLAFSSLHQLYYADSVAGESVMDLFGATLVFHGMVLFVQEGRFHQLLVKTCAALLLGWHVYALILPFALWGFGGEAFALIRSALASGGGVRAAFPALARSRFAALAAASILFGSALLALNLANEYAAFDGERTLSQLPSVKSMMSRLGAADAHDGNPKAAWGDFSVRQFHRAGAVFAPYAVEWLSGRGFSSLEPFSPSPARTAWGAAASVGALAALALFPRRFRAPIAALALMGFCWALAARGNSFQWTYAFEGMFYVGLPLAVWSGALIGARRLLGARLGGALAIGIAALAAPAFALSTLHAAQIRPDADASRLAKEVMADMSAVSEIASEKSVAISPDASRMINDYGHADRAENYYLAGSYFWNGAGGRAEYAVSRYRNESFALRTPDNRHLFLYERADLDDLHRAERRRLESSQADAESFFDVYLAERGLAYLRSPCVREDVSVDLQFFLILYQVGASDPSDHRQLRFPFSDYGVVFDDVCMMFVEPPSHYPIASIRTGQRSPEGDRLWTASIFPPPSAETLAAYESAYQAIADGEPAAQSGFDIYLTPDGGAISYLKRPCSEEDARGRFFLSVHPANADDLPAERREIGHESLNFDFVPPHGVVFNGKCMATRRLPDYEIAKIATGQDAPGGGRLWTAEIAVGD